MGNAVRKIDDIYTYFQIQSLVKQLNWPGFAKEIAAFHHVSQAAALWDIGIEYNNCKGVSEIWVVISCGGLGLYSCESFV